MIMTSIRVHEDVAKSIKKRAAELNIKESEMWRTVIHRGLDYEDTIRLKLSLETLCLGRRIAAHIDENLLTLAKEDAESLLVYFTNLDEER